MRPHANGSPLPPGKHIAKSVKQVTGAQTAGQLLFTAHQAMEANLKQIAKHEGRILGEPRVYVVVEVDFINE